MADKDGILFPGYHPPFNYVMNGGEFRLFDARKREVDFHTTWQFLNIAMGRVDEKIKSYKKEKKMIKFNFEKATEKGPTLQNVPEDGFFVDGEYRLCQKTTSCSYGTIATAEGLPYSGHIRSAPPDLPITRIIGKPEKIEF